MEHHTNKTKPLITLIISLSLLMVGSVILFDVSDAEYDGSIGETDDSLPAYEKALIEMGYRPRYPYPGSEFIQTPSPVPNDAVFLPYGVVPSGYSSAPTRADWENYYDDDIILVKVDVTPTSRFPNGDLSSQEENLLDRIIDDFINFSWPRVKDYFDPQGRVTEVTFLVEDIDGQSRVGGFYQPGTHEFHLDRSDLSWGGVIAAHEFQHYSHRQYDQYENLWVDEGCADLGAYLVYGIDSAVASHVYSYLEYRHHYSLVVSDQTFYQDGTTAYYGSSFLFQLYMKEHYGGKNYTNALVQSTRRGISGIDRALNSLGTSDDFEDAFSKWMIATRINDENTNGGMNYSYTDKTYTHGSVSIKLTKSHSGTPIDVDDRQIRSHSITSIRFSSPPETGEVYRLKLDISEGDPFAAIYEQSNAPRVVRQIDFNAGSAVVDIEGWGTSFNSFQLILSSTSYATVSYELAIKDLDPPVTQLGISPSLPNGDNGWYLTQPRITMSSEADANKYYQLNGGPVQEYGSPFYIPDGIYNLSYWSEDRRGNIEQPRFIDIKIDTGIPTSSIEVEPDLGEDSWFNEAPSISLSSSDPEATITYRWGEEQFQPYSLPITPPEGENTISWKAVDQAGNHEDIHLREFKVDTIPPTFSYEVYPEEPDGYDGWYITQPQISMLTSDTAVLYHAIDGGDTAEYSGPINVPDGEHTVRLFSVDQAGNVGDEIRIDLKVDTTAPTIYGSFENFEYSSENSSRWVSSSPLLTLTPSESDMEINVTINEEEPFRYSGPFEVLEGENNIWVDGKDKAGNPAPQLYYLVKVDKRAPYVDASISSEPLNGWYITRQVRVDLSLIDEDERSSAVKIEYQWNSEDSSVFRSPLSVVDGIHTLTFWATDQAGNVMEPRSIDIKKDSQLPSIYLDLQGVEEGKIMVGDNFTVDLAGSTDETGISLYSVDFEGNGDLTWDSKTVFEHSFEEPGTYRINAYVRDAAGNTRNESITIEVVARESTSADQEGESDDSGDIVLSLVAVIGRIVLLVVLLMLLVVIIKRRSQQEHNTIQPPTKYNDGKSGKNDPLRVSTSSAIPGSKSADGPAFRK